MTQNNVQLQDGNGPLAGFRNQLINGDFKIWQRGVPSGSSSSYSYRGPDRWRSRVEIQKIPCSLDEFASCVQIINSASAGFKQRVEMTGGSQPLAPNSTWTLSCWVEGLDAGQMGQLQIDPDGGTSITGTPEIIETKSGWNRWAVTLTMNATMPTTYAEVSIQSGGPQSWKLTGVQLEPGPVATPFEHRHIGTELALCQRYYQQNSNVIFLQKTGITGSTDSVSTNLWWKVRFRGTPTVLIQSSSYVNGLSYLTFTEGAATVAVVAGTATDSSAAARIVGLNGDAEL